MKTKDDQGPSPTQFEFYQQWWKKLSPAWKKAYNEVFLRRSTEEELPPPILLQIHYAPALRFVGPSAPYPNMSFELDDLSGIVALSKLEILVVTHHRIDNLKLIAQIPQLKSLFVNNNRIASLEGIQALTDLHELYVNSNIVSSLMPLENLCQLQKVYCNYNKINTLEGVGEQHAQNLQQFFCLPNEGLSDATCIKFENQFGIRCKKG
ncbi:MAG: leucine-rich repeat domain-containing protein [Saprospiraceae bacterium]|nr:leucine-rich repeat domain-containing protein [Saprospiraceae bacterium]